MESRFKIGDKVKRLHGMHGGMRPGDVGEVASMSTRGIALVGWEEFWHDPDKFELVTQAPPEYTARKDDSGKLDMNLLDDMPRALKAVVEVMQWAIVDKQPVPYKRGSWLGVEPDRYRAAIKRHERSAAEQATAEVPARLQRDAETNLLHLAHTACSALMALENVLREAERLKEAP